MGVLLTLATHATHERYSRAQLTSGLLVCGCPAHARATNEEVNRIAFFTLVGASAQLGLLLASVLSALGYFGETVLLLISLTGLVIAILPFLAGTKSGEVLGRYSWVLNFCALGCCLAAGLIVYFLFCSGLASDKKESSVRIALISAFVGVGVILNVVRRLGDTLDAKTEQGR